jgi:Leu/Phe-tRNA-protein transferase
VGDDKDFVLVAGELGYVVGSVYTSLSGFRTVSHSGNLQMQGLCSLLQEKGCAFWDFGMHMAYKEAMGCKNVAREEFLGMLHSCRDDVGLAQALREAGRERLNVKSLIHKHAKSTEKKESNDNRSK